MATISPTKTSDGYRVPQRFSIAEILAMMTVFGVVFGLLRRFDVHPAWYLFLGMQGLSGLSGADVVWERAAGQFHASGQCALADVDLAVGRVWEFGPAGLSHRVVDRRAVCRDVWRIAGLLHGRFGCGCVSGAGSGRRYSASCGGAADPPPSDGSRS